MLICPITNIACQSSGCSERSGCRAEGLSRKPLSGPKPGLEIDLREWSLATLISLALIFKEEHGAQSSAYLHLKNWLAHKGVQV